ncbi:MAG: DegT/DnrJ/EryC1/StrS family aminotransferase [Candidatus Omnitrophica bacterium]|nr:DegT/DnrJ/EryC1/StrS family aminotransferase [Candidatus Omnitrophota bacterium]
MCLVSGQVPFIDFSQQYQTIKDEIDVGLKNVFQKGNFILGQEEKDFEQHFAAYCESTYAIGVNSGTDALYLALCALGVKAGDEVILPSHTFIASALGISYLGAKPVLVDIEEQTYNLDPQKLRAAITDKTKAIIAVHLYGQAANMDEINAIAKERGIKVIEDAAQAHGARYKDQRIGSLGDVACFSFYPTKSLGGFGDGGMIVTKDQAVYDKVMMLRDYGRKGRYAHVIKGVNSRLDTLQAVILDAKLEYLDEWNRMRAEKGAYYNELLTGIPGLITPVTVSDRTHVFQTYAIRVKNRDRVLDQMQARGIGVLIHYPIPVHLQEAYADLGYARGDFPVSERLGDEELSLPMFPHITGEQVDTVCLTLKEIVSVAA